MHTGFTVRCVLPHITQACIEAPGTRQKMFRAALPVMATYERQVARLHCQSSSCTIGSKKAHHGDHNAWGSCDWQQSLGVVTWQDTSGSAGEQHRTNWQHLKLAPGWHSAFTQDRHACFVQPAASTLPGNPTLRSKCMVAKCGTHNLLQLCIQMHSRTVNIWQYDRTRDRTTGICMNSLHTWCQLWCMGLSRPLMAPKVCMGPQGCMQGEQN